MRNDTGRRAEKTVFRRIRNGRGKMKYTELGNTGIRVSRICLGCMGFGRPFEDLHVWVVDQPTAQSVIARALELGINFFDTANVYSKGTSEEFLGRSFKNLGVKREEVVIGSKVFFNPGRLGREAILREIDGTLKRLGTDYLDLYLIHRFDYETPIEETMEALDSLVKSGKVRTIGASEMYAYQLHNMQICAEQNGWTKFSVLQAHYNLIYREGERELLPLAGQYNMAVTPYSPLAAGHLTRPTWESASKRNQTDRVSREKYDANRENDMNVIARIDEVAKKHNVPMADIALAWLWAKGVAAPIAGCTRPERVDDAVGALDIELSAEEIGYLEEPYVAHDLVGPIARPGEKYLAGTFLRTKQN